MDFREALDLIDFPQLKRELLQALRGKRSQVHLAKILNVSAQHIYRWEADRRGISWRQFLDFAAASRVDMKEFFLFLGFKGEPGHVPSFLKHCLQNVPAPVVLKVLGCSVFTLSRWRNGKSEPSTEDILKMIHYFMNVLPDALAKLVEIGSLPSVAALHAATNREREFHFKNPVVGALTIAINLQPYLDLEHHDAGMISDFVGIPEEEVSRLLSEMADIGAISRGKNGKYTVRPSSLVLRGNRWENLNLRAYWAKRAADKFERARDGRSGYVNSFSGYHLFPLTRTAHEQVKKKYVDFYNEMVKTAIHANSNAGPESRIFAFNMQVIDLSAIEEEFSA